jgi:RNA polymerase sigma factor (sigma-70 family)
MEKPDQYGEWILHPGNEAKGGTPHPVDEQLLAAARATWPRALAHAKRELDQKNLGTESEGVAGEVWEAVLKAVSRALRRKRDPTASIDNLESYLFTAFDHRLNRVLKREQKRRDTLKVVASTEEFERIESARDTDWVSELDRAITVRQIVAHMDEWTKRVWQARQYGYSWRDISKRLELSEQAAKKRFQYGLEKTREKLLGALKRTKAGSREKE